MIIPVNFYDTVLNPTRDKGCIAVSRFLFTVDQGTGLPIQMILNTAIDSYAGQTTEKDFPIYIPARNVYHSEQHKELLAMFKQGDPFVFVVPQNIEVYNNTYSNGNHYFGYATNFSIWRA